MHPMTKRYAFHGERTVFVNHLLFVCVNGMEDNLIAKSATEGLDFKVQELLVFARGIDVEWGGAAIQAECAYHSYSGKKQAHVISVVI